MANSTIFTSKVQYPTYEEKNVENAIVSFNKDTELLHAGLDLLGIGRYYIHNHLAYDKREFRKNLKRNWSLKCEWCGKKVSSKTEVHYYLVGHRPVMSQERACSEVCSKHIWDEGLLNYLKENGHDPKRYGFE